MNCPVCLKENWSLFRKNVNNGRDYLYCKNCGRDVVRLEPLIDSESDNYEKPYPKDMVNDADYNTWQLNQLREFGLLKHNLFLEMGCGIGGLALKMQGMGKTVHIIERNPHARKYCREHGLQAYCTYNDIQTCSGYDLCYSFHYLEHVLNIKFDIAIQSAIADYVLFCIPTGLSELDNPDHNWLLSSAALTSMLQRSGKPILQKKISGYQLDWKNEKGEITLILIPGDRRILSANQWRNAFSKIVSILHPY